MKIGCRWILYPLLLLFPSSSFSQQIIYISGCKKQEKIRKVTGFYLDQLGIIENICIKIERRVDLPDNFLGATFQVPSTPDQKFQGFKIFIDPEIDLIENMHILAHEMIHVKQYIKDDFEGNQ